MRNLQLWRCSTRKLDYLSEEISCACYGRHGACPEGELFLCTDNLIVRCFSNDGRLKWSKDLSEVSSPRNSPVGIAYLSLINTLSIGFSNGEIFGMTETSANCELKGTSKDGLLAMEWSHDLETLALVTRKYRVMLMSCCYDFVNEVDLLADEFGAKEFITVGWGKKETQFHGSEGKGAAKAKSDFFVDKHAILNNNVLISWKYHGRLFAVGFTMSGIRRFKVFDKEGKLLYTSEKLQGLEANLAWRPSGNTVTTTQKIQDRYLVTFFEKNGLKHGEFDIPVTENIEVVKIIWSQDSEILTLVCKDLEDQSPKILLFTSSNYHWYLKQTLTFSAKHKICEIFWDNNFNVSYNKVLHILFKNGKYYTYTWVWDVDHSTGRCEKDDAIVTVIDGKKLLVSSFRHFVTPPPMANLEIETDYYIDSVHFLFIPNGDDEFNNFLVCSSNILTFYEQSQKKPLKYKISKTIILDKFEFPYQYFNWFWWKKDTLIGIGVDNQCLYKMIEYTIRDDSLIIKKSEFLTAAVVRVHSHPLIPKVYLHMETGKVMAYNSDGIENLAESFPIACPKFCVLPIGDLGYFVGLTHKGLLYLQDKVIMNNVDSIYIDTDYFLIASKNNFLLCTKLTQDGLAAVMDYDYTESPDVYKRRVEIGSKIIIVVPNDTRTVLQMPRGNLEVIEPRPLSLKIVGEHLNSLKYYEAFDLMRKQRINLNLIYDHNPQLFIKNIDNFLEAIKNNSWLSLFLTDLENKDTTKTMYSTSYIHTEENKDCDKKVNFICDMVREHLKTAPNKSSRVLPLLTIYVKKNTIHDLEEALLLVKDLKNQELNGSKLPVSSDEALKYLLYIVDVNKLFDVALGMYDFDLVLLVANKSHKDPKEYIPMINDLNALDENYKRFTINKNLKRYVKAVECLIKCGPSKHEELKTFVKYHSLYREALKMLTPKEYIYKQICDDFGLFLKLKKEFLEAGMMFERADNMEKAIECYKDALEWEMAIKLIQNLPREEFKQICFDFAAALKQNKRHKEALRILEILGANEKEMIMYATDNGEFKSAIRLCYMYDMHELLETQVQPAVLEEYNNVKDLLETNLTNFKNYRDRLEVVRVNKTNAPARRENIPYYNRDFDLYSDVGSTIGSSSGSSRSYRSSKNRRKHERKVASLKEGSQYEDTALVMALHSLVTTTFELRPHVREINLALSCLYRDEEARILQYQLDGVLQEMKDSFKQIWTNNLVIEATNAVIEAELNVPEGGSVVRQGIATLEPHVRIAPVVQDIRWKLDLD